METKSNANMSKCGTFQWEVSSNDLATSITASGFKSYSCSQEQVDTLQLPIPFLPPLPGQKKKALDPHPSNSLPPPPNPLGPLLVVLELQPGGVPPQLLHQRLGVIVKWAWSKIGQPRNGLPRYMVSTRTKISWHVWPPMIPGCTQKTHTPYELPKWRWRGLGKNLLSASMIVGGRLCQSWSPNAGLQDGRHEMSSKMQSDTLNCESIWPMVLLYLPAASGDRIDVTGILKTSVTCSTVNAGCLRIINCRQARHGWSQHMRVHGVPAR